MTKLKSRRNSATPAKKRAMIATDASDRLLDACSEQPGVPPCRRCISGVSTRSSILGQAMLVFKTQKHFLLVA